MAKKQKAQWDEYKIKVETEDGGIMKLKVTMFSPMDDRQGVNLVIMNDLVIKGIWIINGKNGPFVSMPSYKTGDTYSDYVHPISAAFRESLYSQLVKLSKWGDAKKKKKKEEDEEDDDE